MMDENGHELIGARRSSRSLEPAFGSHAKVRDPGLRKGVRNERGSAPHSICRFPPTYCRSFGGFDGRSMARRSSFSRDRRRGARLPLPPRSRCFSRGCKTPVGRSWALGLCLHLLYLIGLGDRAARHGEGCAPCVERIAMPFRELACPLRNAGALCSWLSREAPHAADPPELAELHEILTRMDWVPQMVLSHRQQGVMDQAEEPGLLSDEFEEMVRRAADRLSDREIHHWLRHGRGPVGTADERLLPDRSTEPWGGVDRSGAKPAAGADRPAGEQPGKRDLPAAAPARLDLAPGWRLRGRHHQGCTRANPADPVRA